jgi:hypothetical protein
VGQCRQLPSLSSAAVAAAAAEVMPGSCWYRELLLQHPVSSTVCPLASDEASASVRMLPAAVAAAEVVCHLVKLSPLATSGEIQGT